MLMCLSIGTVGLEKHSQLSLIHLAVFQLIKTLLYQAYQFTLFCDNLFGNSKLFSLLQSLGIRVYNTVQCLILYILLYLGSSNPILSCVFSLISFVNIVLFGL